MRLIQKDRTKAEGVIGYMKEKGITSVYYFFTVMNGGKKKGGDNSKKVGPEKEEKWYKVLPT